MKWYFSALCILFCPVVLGQNLVKNPGFEEYYRYPDEKYEFASEYEDSAFICKHWYRLRKETPSYYHINAKDIRYGIPYNRFGYYPALEDSAYIGSIVLDLQGFVQPISGEFVTPLNEGKMY